MSVGTETIYACEAGGSIKPRVKRRRSEPWVTAKNLLKLGKRAIENLGQESAARLRGLRLASYTTQGSLRFTLGFMLPPASQA